VSSDAAYDPVAALYEQAFSDIRVREVEWRWLMRALDHCAARPRVLDLGCGNGALLAALEPRIASGVGVDVSTSMLGFAEARAATRPTLRFTRAETHALPFEAGSFDVVISFLSFRYLDWERSWPEIRRVLAPSGRFLLIDLAQRGARLRDAPALVRAAIRHGLAPRRHPAFARDVQKLTEHPAWLDMLRRHPIRSLRAYEHFFRTRLPGARFVSLDVLPARRVVALDSGPLAALP
jgi:SAM-dependent methyltransferase